MRITGLTLSQFQACTSFVSYSRYSGNGIVHPDARDRPAQRSRETGQLRNQCQARLTVSDSHGAGSRLTVSGRHGPYACWHLYRDVLREVFNQFPGAVIISGNYWRVTYRGYDGFQELYPATGRKNIGSPIEPVTMPELCSCGLDIRELDEQVRHRRPAIDYAISRALDARGMTLASASLDPEPLAASLDLTERLATRGIAELAAFHSELAPLASFELGDPYWDNDPDRVSPQVSRASAAYAASEQLLSGNRDISHGDKGADPLVFGPEDGGAMRHD